MQNNKRVELVQEIYETYHDIKNHNITLTRLYVILILAVILVFGILCLVMLFLKQFNMSMLYFIITSLGVTLIKKRKRKIVARYFDWFSFLGSSFCIIISVTYNIYEYSNASGSLLYIIMLVNMIYIIFVSDDRQKNKIAYVIFILFIVIFVDLFLLDNYIWHPDLETTNFHEILYLVTVFIIFSSIVLSSYIVGLKSVEDIEKLEANRQKVLVKNYKDRYSDYINKKDFENTFLQRQKMDYHNLNICMFEITLLNKDNSTTKIDHFYNEKVMKDFISLLKVCYPKNKTLIRWELNTMVLLLEENNNDMFLMLETINKDFERIIEQQQEKYNIYLKTVAKYYHELSTKKHPKIILEKINEVVKLKYETNNMGKKYTVYKADAVRNIDGK